MYLLLLISLGIFLISILLMWSVHVSMNKDEKVPYDFVTFEIFMKEFNKYRDDPNLQKYEWGGKSIFLKKNQKYVLYLHANIVKINDKCMIFYPFSYLKYCMWMRKFNRKKYRIKGLWKEKQS